jgi:hypothetical protein
MLRASLACAALAAASAQTWPACTNGIDYPNADMRGFPLALVEPDPLICAAMCAAEPSCAVYVFDPVGCTMPATGVAACYLKSSVPPQAPKDCRCSGFPNRTSSVPPQDNAAYTMANDALSVHLGSRGLVYVESTDGVTGAVVPLAIELDTFALAVDDFLFNSSTLPAPTVSSTNTITSYTYTSQPGGSGGLTYTIVASYELQQGWRFIRKHLSIASSDPATPLSIISASPFDVLRTVTPAPLASALYPSGDMGIYGVFGRFLDNSGVLVAAENPFLYPFAEPVAPLYATPGSNATLFHVGYHASMWWNQTTPSDSTPRAYEADSGLLSLYSLLPQTVPPSFAEMGPKHTRITAQGAPLPRQRVSKRLDTGTGMAFEWSSFLPSPAYSTLIRRAHNGEQAQDTWMNAAERDAFRSAVDALYQSPPALTAKIHIPWTENDYQVRNDCEKASKRAGEEGGGGQRPGLPLSAGSAPPHATILHLQAPQLTPTLTQSAYVALMRSYD